MRWAESYKPAADVATHLMAAWLMWAAVGSVLLGFGVSWTWAAEPAAAPWIVALAFAIGVVKSRLVLDRAARRLVERIVARGDGRCLGGFLSPYTWALVIVMMGAGRLLRSFLGHGVVGPVYVAIGAALCVSSRITWNAWKSSHHAR